MNYHCGPYWLPQWLKKFLSKRFNASCGVHDLIYKEQTISRFKADTGFLSLMVNQSESVFDLLIAGLFFIAVRIFGGISWRRNAQQLHH